MSLVLSLFPGIGLLDMAFEEAGFCVVRGPDLLWGGDIKRFHPPAGKFDGVIGGPPCQAFSRLVHIARAQGHRIAENLIPEFERVVSEAAPAWFLMENVPNAPRPYVPPYTVHAWPLADHWCGGETGRTRLFSFGAVGNFGNHRPEMLTLHICNPLPTVVCDAREIPVAIGGSGKRKLRRGMDGGVAPHEGPRINSREALRRQGFDSAALDECPLTETGKRQAIGNGVPLPMGRAVANAVREAIAQSAPPSAEPDAVPRRDEGGL